MGSLEGKNALVTGAGRGIGEATARKLASHGANVLINDLDADVAEAVASSIPGAVAFPADLTDPEAADQVVNAALDALGGLDIVVNNAGYIWHSAIHNMSDEQWDADDRHSCQRSVSDSACLRALATRERRTGRANAKSRQYFFDHGRARWRDTVSLFSRQGRCGGHDENLGQGMGAI